MPPCFIFVRFIFLPAFFSQEHREHSNYILLHPPWKSKTISRVHQHGIPALPRKQMKGHFLT